ncbi:MAG: hypothetical protein KGJ86_20995 [Chloroflexota bacterium]|nr:hypothetical protein [Chloroflexota bacterium]
MDEFDEFLDPTGDAQVAAHAPASRLDGLKGKRLGIIENNKTNADKFLMMVYEELHDRYGVELAKMIRKKELSQPALADQIEEIAGISDFAITGIGD